jgi:hypothetical protein
MLSLMVEIVGSVMYFDLFSLQLFNDHFFGKSDRVDLNLGQALCFRWVSYERIELVIRLHSDPQNYACLKKWETRFTSDNFDEIYFRTNAHYPFD